MAESATKDLESLGLNHRDAANRETRSVSDISVEGFETCSLQRYAVELALRKHFASYGEMLSVSVFKSVALMRFAGEDTAHKALELSGTDVGGWTAIVKPSLWKSVPYVRPAAKIKEYRMFVSGYDTGLPEIDIKIAVCKHLSSCGDIIYISLHSSKAYVIIRGERCVDKALKLNGQVGGMNLVVDPNVLRPQNSGKRKRVAHRQPIGYTPPFLLEKEKETETEKERRRGRGRGRRREGEGGEEEEEEEGSTCFL